MMHPDPREPLTTWMPSAGSPIGELVDLARERRPEDTVFADLLEPYYRELPDVDADGRRLDDIYGVALVHLNIGRHRPPGTTLVSVCTPDPELDGWGTNRSVVLVVTDDAPFLVDTMRLVLDRQGLGTHLLVHPMLSVHRDEDGHLIVVHPDQREGHLLEAWTQIEIDRCPPEQADALAAELREVIGEVHLVVDDFPAMRDRMRALADEDPLLDWLAEDEFVFLGAGTYDRTPDGGLVMRADTGLGMQRRDHSVDPPPVPLEITEVTPLLISRSDGMSRIHRSARRTCVSVRAPGGGRHRFLGLLGWTAYRHSVFSIPSVGDRARAVLGLAEGGVDSHTGRSVRNVLETLPREVLFELDQERLAQLVIDIVGLQERRIVRVFDIPEPVGDWSTVMVYLPRDRFAAATPKRVASMIAEAYGSAYRDLESTVGTSTLARIIFTVRRSEEIGVPDLVQLARRVDEATVTWWDRWRRAATAALGSEAEALVDQLSGRVPANFQASVAPERAVEDLALIAELATSDRRLGALLGPDPARSEDVWRFRVARRDEPISLAELLPLLADLGLTALDERPSEFDLGDHRIHYYDIGVQLPGDAGVHPERHHELVRTFERLMCHEIEADGLDQLVLIAGLRGEQVNVLRAYVRYLRQIGFPFSQIYIEETLARLPSVVTALAAYVDARFDPKVIEREAAITEARAHLDEMVDRLQSLDDDRICRALVALIDATLRTTAYRTPDTIAHKFDPSKVPDLPAPRPRFEIFVCSPRVEGVHLRAGPIARGGIRWSDRPEDFRTEVLGLVKAQVVKNAVIVPEGAKGGFVVKRPPASPEQLRRVVADCYVEFINALLDLTDDVRDGKLVHPDRVVVHDGPDPYLVVAADKGTATFSDLANSVAEDRGFWLGDAFASGGSSGYDHKAMAITARGAWESVRRHARALGKNADQDPITVVGIGDMSGDVFGNGMLRSPHLRLVAAFDHRHVFLDPNPDPNRSYEERLRLFALPRSSWGDYDTTLVSAGGGVFSRAAKSIEVSPQAAKVLGIAPGTRTPIELIRAILCAPVDLLWNGGIGTYIKASHESHASVGDRANDAVRIDAADLRSKMVGEGGNLGVTQLGRIEYALAGGLINTDAIDNAAGVDCSDHEVNIKILLASAVTAGEIDRPSRDELLASMTDEVADLVLANNRAQTLALSIARRQSLPMVNVHARYLDLLEAEGWLDRNLEFLPSDKRLAERQATGTGLTAPEFAVLIAYTKNADITEVLATDFPDDPILERDLMAYFPAPLREQFGEHIRSHRLRREIVATKVINQMVNLSGISFDHRMTEDTGASVADVTRAWIACREILGFDRIWSAIDRLERDVSLDTQLELFLEARRMQERCALWLLRHRRPPLDIAAEIEVFAGPIRAVMSVLESLIQGSMAELVDSLTAERLVLGVPEALAHSSAIWRLVHTSFDVVEVAQATGFDPVRTGSVYWQVFDRLDLMWLWNAIGRLPRSDRWQTQARSALRDDLMSTLAVLARTVIATGEADIDVWISTNHRAVARVAGMFTEIRRAETFGFTALSVALRQLRNVALTGARHTR